MAGSTKRQFAIPTKTTNAMIMKIDFFLTIRLAYHTVHINVNFMYGKKK